jgi:hypothetical protein
MPEFASRRGAFPASMLLVAACFCSIGVKDAAAQNLIVSLPEQDGAWIRLEGSYVERKARPKATGGEGDLEVAWRSDLTIKSVGKEDAEFGGKSVPCRWVEFKVEFKPTKATATEGATPPAPLGNRLYKVLLPESAVTGRHVDEGGLPVTFLPIVKGWRKIGDRDAEQVKESALIVYPMISLLTHYPNLQTDGAPGSVDVTLGSFEAQAWKGSRTLSNATVRSVNEGSIWTSDKVPFGTIKVAVKVQRFEKDATAPEDTFKLMSEVSSELAAVESGADATSDLPDAN